MNIEEKKQFKIFILIAAVLALLTYIYPIYFNSLSNGNFYIPMLYGLLTSLIFVIKDKIWYGLVLVLFYPFTISNKISLTSIPLEITIPIIFMITGVVSHIIIYHKKFKFNSFSISLVLYAMTLAIGGFFSKDSEFCVAWYKPWMSLIILIAGLAIFLLSGYINSNKNIDFKEICYLFTILAVIIIIQIILFISRIDGGLQIYLKNKMLELNWGCSNNIATSLMFSLPLTFYLFSNNKNYSRFIYLIISILEIIFIFLTMSRGAILTTILFIPIIFILYFFKSDSKIIYSSSLILVLLIFATILFLYFKKNSDVYIEYKTILKILNFDNLNGRKIVYSQALDIIKHNKFFGIGLFAETKWNLLPPFTFAHNTFLQVLLNSGFVGLVIFIIHLFFRYYPLVYKINKKKIVILVAYLMTATYGFIDVTYLTPNFMIQLFLLMVLINKSNLGEVDTYEIKN